MKQTLMKEILVRIQSSSPTLFKRLQAIFLSLAGIVVVLIFLTPLGINLHGFEVYVNWNTVSVLAGFAFINMLPVSDPKVLPKSTNGEEDLVGGRPNDRNPPNP